jgi:hypothetical protein
VNPEVKRLIDRGLNAQYMGASDDAWIALYDAISILNEQGNNHTDEFHHDWTPEEIEKRKKSLKSMTLHDLKRQVDAAVSEMESHVKGIGFHLCCLKGEDGFIWTIGDFEIRRRK